MCHSIIILNYKFLFPIVNAEENGDLLPPLGKVLDCITSIVTVAKLPDILEHGKNMIAAFLNSLRPELSWQGIRDKKTSYIVTMIFLLDTQAYVVCFAIL